MNELAELFERDPLELTKEDRAKIIARMREARNQFMLGDKTAGKVKKPSKSPADLLNLNLDDIQIDG